MVDGLEAAAGSTGAACSAGEEAVMALILYE
jgi:hypothetical protein